MLLCVGTNRTCVLFSVWGGWLEQKKFNPFVVAMKSLWARHHRFCKIFAKFINVIRDTSGAVILCLCIRRRYNRMWKNDKIENLFKSMKILFCGDSERVKISDLAWYSGIYVVFVFLVCPHSFTCWVNVADFYMFFPPFLSLLDILYSCSTLFCLQIAPIIELFRGELSMPVSYIISECGGDNLSFININ